MKQTHFLFCLLLLWLSSNNLAFGQIYPNEAEAAKMRDDIPRNAPLVFEGYMINQGKEYIGKDRQTYVSVLFKVEKVLRGDVKVGYVEYQRASFNAVDSAGNIVGIPKGQHGTDFTAPYPNEKSTYFFKWTDEDNILSNSENKNTKQATAYYYYAGQIRHSQVPILSDGSLHSWMVLGSFKTDEDYQDFMAKYGLGEPRKLIEQPQKKRLKTEKSKKQNIQMLPTDLFLDFSNTQTTVSGSNIFFEFDIRARTPIRLSSDTTQFNPNSYLDSMQLYLKYSTNAFGSFLKASGGATITSLIPTANSASYQLLQVVDYGNAALRLRLNAKSLADSTQYNRYKIPISNSFMPLFHVKLRISDCQAAKGIDWVADSIVGGIHTFNHWVNFKPHPKSHRSLTLSEDYYLQKVIAAPNARMLSPCSAQSVIKFSPATVRAGFGDVLTITGTGGKFGYNSNKKGRVLFRDAVAAISMTTNGIGYYDDTKGLDPEDIIRWRPDTIKIKVPSHIRKGYDRTPLNTKIITGIAGSGTVRVDTFVTGAPVTTPPNIVGFSIDTLHVSHAALNYPESQPIINGDTIARKKARYWLFNRNCQKEYHVKVDTSMIVKFGSGIRGVIIQALADWNTKIGYNIFVHDWNGDNVIRYQVTNNNGGLMDTPLKNTTNRIYNNSSDTAIINTGFDINVYNFVWNTTISNAAGTTNPLGANEYDFYSAILHELGHGIGLDHCINYDAVQHSGSAMEIMHGGGAKGEYPRTTMNSGGGNTGLGGKDIVDRSKASNLTWLFGENTKYAKLGSPTASLTLTKAPITNNALCAYNATKNLSVTLTTNPVISTSGISYKWIIDTTGVQNDTTFMGQGTPSLTVKNKRPPYSTTNPSLNNLSVKCGAYLNSCEAFSDTTIFKAGVNVILNPTQSRCLVGASRWTIPYPTPINGTFTAYNVANPTVPITVITNSLPDSLQIYRAPFSTAGTYKIVYKAVDNTCPVTKDSTYMTTFYCATLTVNTHKIYINEIYKNQTAYRNINATLANNPCDKGLGKK
jgi:hypothetical protein